MTTSQIFQEICNCLERASSEVYATSDPMECRIIKITLLSFRRELLEIVKREQRRETLDGVE